MHYIFIIPRTLWKVFFGLNFVVGLIVLYPFFYILLSNKNWYPLAFKLKRFWAKWITFLPGIFYSIDWQIPKADLPKSCVYCANHVSYLDIIMSYIVVPNYFIFMAKQEVEKAPLFRIFFKDMNILVDRKSKISSHRAFIRAGEELKKGNSVFLFPEGGIMSNTGQLKNFKNGVFKLAIEHQVPVVAITYLNNWRILQTGGFLKVFGNPGIARVVVHPPISTVGMTENDLVSLRTNVHDLMEKDLEKYYSKN